MQNKLIRVTIIVDISIIGFNAHCKRLTRAVHSHFALETGCVFTTSLRIFHNPVSNCFFKIFSGWTVRRLCVTGTNLGQQKHNKFRACALPVPSVRLALV